MAHPGIRASTFKTARFTAVPRQRRNHGFFVHSPLFFSPTHPLQARLEGWTVSVAQAQALGLALAGDVNLTTLVLRRAGLHRASLAALLSALARAPALATIHIDANVVPVGEQPIDDLLGELIMVPPQLQSLAVTSSGVTDAGASAIAAALGNSPPLVYLNLWNNAIAAPGASSLAKVNKQ